MLTKLRAQKITIEIPRRDAEPWVHVTVQRVEMDDDLNELNVVDRWDTFSLRFSEVATNIKTFSDPVLGTGGNISTAGIANALTTAVIQWMMDIHGGEVIENGDLIIATD